MSFICLVVMNQFASKSKRLSKASLGLLYIYYIYIFGQKSTSCQRLSSSLVECLAANSATQVRIWVLPELYSKIKDFFFNN